MSSSPSPTPTPTLPHRKVYAGMSEHDAVQYTYNNYRNGESIKTPPAFNHLKDTLLCCGRDGVRHPLISLEVGSQYADRIDDSY